MRGIGMMPFLMACASDNIIEKQDNVLPTILITSHSDGVEVQDSYIETFRATAADEDHDLNELSVLMSEKVLPVIGKLFLRMVPGLRDCLQKEMRM